MKTRYSDEIEYDEATDEREINLNASTILGIFFLLALICGVFFAFGYSLGRKSAPSSTAETLAAPIVTTVPPAPKPTPGSRTTDRQTTPDTLPDAAADTTAVAPVNQSTQVAQPAEAPDQAIAPAPQSITIPITKPAPARHTANVTVPVAPPPAARQTAALPAAVLMVQIAAVSHKEDADVLQTALERRGYHITIVHVPQDKLLHVQIGPFNNRKDADAMRERLLNDGYNAIVK